ncbi:MAG TPA: VIT family protein [Candidatus Saccharimonadales bacterium]|nr:VIT family protein [Candidatus Saccharimonadales bacterium]
MPKTQTAQAPLAQAQADLRSEHVIVSNAGLNSLRAAVLGANDGIVSVSSIILGVAGAGVSRTAIFTAGMAGLAAGALSMAVGEYVSVSSQRDTERAYIVEEKMHLAEFPDAEFADLARTFERKGLTPATARKVAEELTAHDAVAAHLDAEFNLNEKDLSNPFIAAISSLIAFTVGGIIPLAVVMLAGASVRLLAVALGVIIALTVTGYLSATAGHAPRLRAIGRVIVGGILAMAITYGIGRLFGHFVS